MDETQPYQRVCFKTCMEESQGQNPKDSSSEDPDAYPDIPVFNLEDSEPDDFISPFGSGQTPPVLSLKQKSFLFLPKMDARNRLTSTPNQNALRLGNELDTCEFSPTCDSPSELGIIKRLSSPYQKEDLADIKSVLFPSHHKTQRDVPHSVTFVSESDKKRKRSQSAERSIFSKEAQSLHGSINTLKNISRQQMGNPDALVHDSGISSLAASVNSTACSFLHEQSIVPSPLKRRAEDTDTHFFLESPMKRLAVMSLENSRDNDSSNEQLEMDTVNLSQPGSLFLFDRNVTGESAIAAELSPPTPVFANAISFSPPKEFRLRSPDEVLLNDFQFAKPLRPHKKSCDATENSRSQLAQSDEPVIGSNIGLRDFDIIRGLAKRNLHHIIREIFTTVRKKDILRCSRVSQSWATICKENSFLRRQIKSLKKEYDSEEQAHGSENITAKEAIVNALLKSPAKTGNLRDLSSGRSTLGNLQARERRTPTKKPLSMPTTPSGRNQFVPADDRFQHNQAVKRTLQFGETLRPCPMCGWTAKVYGGGSNKGLCYRVECRYAFCTMCKSAYHSPEKCRIKTTTHSPPHDTTIRGGAIGTKKSKQRLKKRLLM